MFALGLGPFVDRVDADYAADLLAASGFPYRSSPVATLPFLGQSSGLVIYSKVRAKWTNLVGNLYFM